MSTFVVQISPLWLDRPTYPVIAGKPRCNRDDESISWRSN